MIDNDNIHIINIDLLHFALPVQGQLFKCYVALRLNNLLHTFQTQCISCQGEVVCHNR